LIKHLLFDLDNTLYPESTGLEDFVFHRMVEFSAGILGMDYDRVRAERMAMKAKYGTTLEWLMGEYGFDDERGFYADVHPEEELQFLRRDPALRPMLEPLAFARDVFTNGPGEHAELVLGFLGVRDLFGNVFDIRFHGLRGKPRRSAYERVFGAIAADPSECVLFDDNVHCVEAMVGSGGTGVLVDELLTRAPPGMERIRSIHDAPDWLKGRAAARPAVEATRTHLS
jgi:putative hydrolase of the HAD superfamily